MKILNKGRRAYVVNAESVLRGGELSPDKKSKYINAGETVEVTAECGNFLSSYRDIAVLEKEKKGK